MGLCSLPEKLVKQFTHKTDLALLGRKHPRLKFYLPESYVWYNRNQTEEGSLKELEDFFDIIENNNSCNYSTGCKWVVKKEAMSRGNGVNVLTSGISVTDLRISKEYGFSTKKIGLAQEYIQNPLLLPSAQTVLRTPSAGSMMPIPDIGYKWDFRMYALMIMDNETSKITCYLYKDGFARRCSKPYRYRYEHDPVHGNPREKEYLQTHLTNTFINCKNGDKDLQEYIKRTKLEISNMSELEKRFLPQFDDDNDSIGSQISDSNENEDEEIPISMSLDEAWGILTEYYGEERTKKAKLDIIDMFAVLFRVIVNSYDINAESNRNIFYKKNFGFFGLDGILDSNMKPWILEVNKFPDLRCYTLNQLNVKKKLLLDTFGMVYDINPEEFIMKDDLEEAFTELNAQLEFDCIHKRNHANVHAGTPKKVPAWSSPSQTATPTQMPTENPCTPGMNTHSSSEATPTRLSATKLRPEYLESWIQLEICDNY